MNGALGVDAPPIVLDAVLASECPVKTRHAFAGDRPSPDDPPSLDTGATDASSGLLHAAAEHREAERASFVDRVLGRLLATCPDAADLRTITALDQRTALTTKAIRSGRALIVGPALPPDPARHRAGSPDALLRSDDGTGAPRYQPVLARWHKVLRRRRDDESAHDDPADTIDDRPRLADLATPFVTESAAGDLALRLESRRADFLQLATHHRLLAAIGADGGPWGALIGTDFTPTPRLTWVRLNRPALRVVDHEAASGWRAVTLVEQADAELRRRVAIADAARSLGPSAQEIVAPVVIDECRGCRWWQACRSELDPDDLSLRIARGRLDRGEVSALRARGITTVAELAATDLAALLPTYLPEVAHRPEAERRLRALARRARMLDRGDLVERDTTGPIAVPAGEVEIDLDIETSATGRVYLWGFAVDLGHGPCYVEFSRFDDLDDGGELDLARRAMAWLRGLVESDRATRVYHYSGYEVAMIESLATRAPEDEVLGWAAAYARTAFIDLLQIVQANFFGAAGLGLKQIAVRAGFHWRDPDPGGLNSQRWFDDAVHAADAEVRSAARQRVLDYNEDDVRATAALRAWLRAQ